MFAKKQFIIMITRVMNAEKVKHFKPTSFMKDSLNNTMVRESEWIQVTANEIDNPLIFISIALFVSVLFSGWYITICGACWC